METSPAPAPQRSPVHVPVESVRAMVNDDGAVLLDVEQGLCFTMSAVGGVIWTELQAGRSDAEILRLLGERFPEQTPATLEADFQKFLADLRGLKLLTHTTP